MSSLQLDTVAGLHIEPTNICTLKCAGCARTRFIQQWPDKWKNYSLDPDALFRFLDIDLTSKKINLCGNYGDPIYHPNLYAIIKKFKNYGAIISIDTNGSYRKAEWWQELCSLFDVHDQVCFSIDGTPDNFTNYRVNADWDSIRVGIDACVKSSAKTVWKYIPFRYNQHNTDQARQLSVDLGIDFFDIVHSDRFDDVTEYLRPDDGMLGLRYLQQIEFKQNQTSTIINPQCQNQREHYISANGFYTPCCYVGDHRFHYKTQFGKYKKDYDINSHTLSQILNQPATVNFYNTLTEHPACQFNCPSKT